MRRILSGLLITLLISSCAYQATVQRQYLTKDEIAERNRQNLGDLYLGMKREEVVSLMGKPWTTGAFMSDSGKYTVLYYITQRISHGRTTEDEMTPVVLKNGNVIGWGWRFFSGVLEIRRLL